MMYFGNSSLESISLHRVGNKANDEGVQLSKYPLDIEPHVKALLMTYFLSPFKPDEFYHLFHESELALNTVFSVITRIFENPATLHEESVHLARHLYDHSSHPKIKAGEFYVVYLKNCLVGNEEADAIGLFKSESRETYLRVFPKGDGFVINCDDGININKLDKGCLIFNLEPEKGFLVSSVDNLGKHAEARFWKDDFIKMKSREDNYFHTQNMITFCRSFVTEKLPEEHTISKADQADLLNKSVKYLKEQDHFDLGEFSKEVIGEPKLIKSFKNYKNQFENEWDVKISDEFDISDSAVKKQARVMRSVIKLDKNFHVYVHGSREMIEKGFDQEKSMHFYRLFFKDEA